MENETVAGASNAVRPMSFNFDYVLAFSGGGTSVTAENVQLLCARHNLQNHDTIL
jgi:hypothetical protein